MNSEQDRIEQIEDRMARLEGSIKELVNALNNSRLKNDMTKDSSESPLSESDQAKVDDIMNRFDFSKVHRVMEMLGWKWAYSKGVPTIDEIRAEAKRLLVDAVTERTNIATGGFRAVYEDAMDDNDPYIGLEFILEECEGFEEE